MSKVRNLTIFNYFQKIDILVIINQCKTTSVIQFKFLIFLITIFNYLTIF